MVVTQTLGAQLSASERFALGDRSRLPDDEHVARCLHEQLAADRAEQKALRNAAVPRADHDQIRAGFARRLDNRVDGLARRLERRTDDSASGEFPRRPCEETAVRLLLLRIGVTRVWRVAVDRLGDADDRDLARDRRRDLGDSVQARSDSGDPS
jgi:hypothetical protein